MGAAAVLGTVEANQPHDHMRHVVLAAASMWRANKMVASDNTDARQLCMVAFRAHPARASKAKKRHSCLVVLRAYPVRTPRTRMRRSHNPWALARTKSLAWWRLRTRSMRARSRLDIQRSGKDIRNRHETSTCGLDVSVLNGILGTEPSL